MNGSANNPVCRENRLSRRAKWLYSIFKRVGDSLSSRIELLKTAPSTPVIARDSLMATKIVFGFNRCGSLCRLNRYLRRAKRPYSDYTGPGSSPTNPGPVGRGYLQYHWQLVGVIGCRLNTTRDTAFCRVNSVFRRAKRPSLVRETPTSRAGHVVGGTGMEVVSSRCAQDIDVTDWYKQNEPENPTYFCPLAGWTTSPKDRTNCTPTPFS